MKRDRNFIYPLVQFAQHSLKQLGQQPSVQFARRGLLLAVIGWLLISAIALARSAVQPIDGVLVLGGSIQREIYAAELSTRHPKLPILISQGSDAPCIYKIFERDQAPVHRVWLEQCADSTFGNFYFSLPILHAWGVRHVQVVTSPTHLPRALWLARVMLSSHGIWVTPSLVKEIGVPGNRESWWKTGLDVGRGGLWAIASLFYQPKCNNILPLSQVDMSNWASPGMQCERQADLD